MSTCPHPTCTAPVEWDRFACRSHWFALSPSIRNRISRAWRGVLSGRAGAVAEHDAAKQEAFDHWRVTP